MSKVSLFRNRMGNGDCSINDSLQNCSQEDSRERKGNGREERRDAKMMFQLKSSPPWSMKELWNVNGIDILHCSHGETGFYMSPSKQSVIGYGKLPVWKYNFPGISMEGTPKWLSHKQLSLTVRDCSSAKGSIVVYLQLSRTGYQELFFGKKT